MARGSGWGRDSGERTSDGEEVIVGDLATDLSVSEAQRARIRLRERWELASVLSFLRVFRPLITDDLQLSAEEIERALISPNEDLGRIHIALLKGILPINKNMKGPDAWITYVCKKLATWWSWVAEGEIPLKADNGKEIFAYKQLDPTIRLLILKALCEVRVEQDDILKYIADELKKGTDVGTFRKERMGTVNHGITYWHEGDPIIGHRLYREISKIESKQKAKGKSCAALPPFCSHWDTVATNLEEFQKISDNLSSNEVAGEAFIGGIVKTEILPILQKLEKKKARALKRKQRQIQQLEGLLSIRVSSTRSCRKRRLVRYTFDEYDRTIDEAIEISTEPIQVERKENGHQFSDHDIQDDENDDDYDEDKEANDPDSEPARYVKYQDQKPDRYHAAATKKRLRERPVRNAECNPLIILDSEDENPAKAS